jgi:hypothetical protein
MIKPGQDRASAGEMGAADRQETAQPAAVQLGLKVSRVRLEGTVTGQGEIGARFFQFISFTAVHASTIAPGTARSRPGKTLANALVRSEVRPSRVLATGYQTFASTQNTVPVPAP